MITYSKKIIFIILISIIFIACGGSGGSSGNNENNGNAISEANLIKDISNINLNNNDSIE